MTVQIASSRPSSKMGGDASFIRRSKQRPLHLVGPWLADLILFAHQLFLFFAASRADGWLLLRGNLATNTDEMAEKLRESTATRIDECRPPWRSGGPRSALAAAELEPDKMTNGSPRPPMPESATGSQVTARALAANRSISGEANSSRARNQSFTIELESNG